MESLTEIQALRSFLGSLLGKPNTKKVQIGNVAPSQLEKQAREIVQKVIASLNAKTRKVERKRSAETVVLRYHVSIGGKKFVIKAFVLQETKFFNMSLWTDDQEKMLDVLAVGDLRSKYRLRAMAKIRLKPWAKGEK